MLTSRVLTKVAIVVIFTSLARPLYAQETGDIRSVSAMGLEQSEQSANNYMIDFTNQNNRHLWRVSNDNVMGGISKGAVVLTSEKTRFSGTISLENNGGFSAVFHKVDVIDADLTQLSLDIAGDGQRYQVRVIANHRKGSFGEERIHYFHEFDTQENKRQTLTFNLIDFQATFRGRKIDNAPALSSEDIEEIGFLFKK
ncbi:CIA30 family protein, partial [Vibrio genomosp. F10]